MSIQIQGYGGTVAEVDGPTWRALRVAPRPPEYGSLGCYMRGMVTGTMAAGLAAAANIFSYRWGDATRLSLLTQVTIGAASNSATGFAIGTAVFALKLARSFTASSTGGTAATLTGNNGKLRTSMGGTLVTDIRISSTAALGLGTASQDTDAVAASCYGVGSGTTGGVLLTDGAATYLWNPDGSQEHPIVFAQNEGFQIQATVPATGTWQAAIGIKWYEVASY